MTRPDGASAGDEGEPLDGFPRPNVFISGDEWRDGPARYSEAMRVRRTSGLLVPGFSKRWTVDAETGIGVGTTYLWGLPIGRFAVVTSPPEAAPTAGAKRSLLYRRWPVVDDLVLRENGAWDGTGRIRMPGSGRELRFCRFVLGPPGASDPPGPSGPPSA